MQAPTTNNEYEHFLLESPTPCDEEQHLPLLEVAWRCADQIQEARVISRLRIFNSLIAECTTAQPPQLVEPFKVPEAYRSTTAIATYLWHQISRKQGWLQLLAYHALGRLDHDHQINRNQLAIRVHTTPRQVRTRLRIASRYFQLFTASDLDYVKVVTITPGQMGQLNQEEFDVVLDHVRNYHETSLQLLEFLLFPSPLDVIQYDDGDSSSQSSSVGDDQSFERE